MCKFKNKILSCTLKFTSEDNSYSYLEGTDIARYIRDDLNKAESLFDVAGERKFILIKDDANYTGYAKIKIRK